jgi:hypothetical protein
LPDLKKWKYTVKDLDISILGSLAGIEVSIIVLNLAKTHTMLVDTMLTNLYVFAVFAFGCQFLGIGLGQATGHRFNAKKWRAIFSFGYSTVSAGAFPLALESILFATAQPEGIINLNNITFGYFVLMSIIGVFSLIVGLYLIKRE